MVKKGGDIIKRLLPILLITVVLASGCGSPQDSDIRVAEAYFNAVVKGDKDAALSLVLPEDRDAAASIVDEHIAEMSTESDVHIVKEKTREQWVQWLGKPPRKVGSPAEEGYVEIFFLVYTSGGSPEEWVLFLPLKYVGGKWYCAFR